MLFLVVFIGSLVTLARTLPSVMVLKEHPIFDSRSFDSRSSVTGAQVMCHASFQKYLGKVISYCVPRYPTTESDTALKVHTQDRAVQLEGKNPAIPASWTPNTPLPPLPQVVHLSYKDPGEFLIASRNHGAKRYSSQTSLDGISSWKPGEQIIESISETKYHHQYVWSYRTGSRWRRRTVWVVENYYYHNGTLGSRDLSACSQLKNTQYFFCYSGDYTGSFDASVVSRPDTFPGIWSGWRASWLAWYPRRMVRYDISLRLSTKVWDQFDFQNVEEILQIKGASDELDPRLLMWHRQVPRLTWFLSSNPNTRGFIDYSAYRLEKFSFRDEHSMYAVCAGSNEGSDALGACLVNYTQSTTQNQLVLQYPKIAIPAISSNKPLEFKPFDYLGFMSKTGLVHLVHHSNWSEIAYWKVQVAADLQVMDGVLEMVQAVVWGTINYHFIFYSQITGPNGEPAFNPMRCSIQFDACRLRTGALCEPKNCLPGYYAYPAAQPNNTCIPEGWRIWQNATGVDKQRCTDPNCLECPTNINLCTRCEDRTANKSYLINNACKPETEFTDGYGRNLDANTMERCADIHCQSCFNNYQICEVCVASETPRYLQNVSEGVQCSLPRDFPAGMGLDKSDSSNLKMSPCTVKDCIDCYDDHTQCVKCIESSLNYMVDSNGQCVPQFMYPAGLGYKVSTASMVSCENGNCLECNNNYQNCTRCGTGYLLATYSPQQPDMKTCEAVIESCMEGNVRPGCAPVKCNFTLGYVPINITTCKPFRDIVKSVSYNRIEATFEILLTEANSDMADFEVKNWITILRQRNIITNVSEAVHLNNSLVISPLDIAGKKYRIAFLPSTIPRGDRLVALKLWLNPPLAGEPIIKANSTKKRVLQTAVQGDPKEFPESEPGFLEAEQPGFFDSLLKTLASYRVFVILTFVPYLCLCWWDMQVAIYLLQTLFTAHVLLMLAAPKISEQQIFPQDHKIYALLLPQLDHSTNAECSHYAGGQSPRFLAWRNVSCSAIENFWNYGVGILAAIAANLLTKYLFADYLRKKANQEPNLQTEIATDELRRNQEAEYTGASSRPIRSLQFAWGVLVGAQPAVVFFGLVHFLLNNKRIDVDSAIFAVVMLAYLVFIVMGVVAGCKLNKKQNVALSTDPKVQNEQKPDLCYNRQIGEVSEIAGYCDVLWRQFDWMAYQPIFTVPVLSWLPFLEPVINALRNVGLVCMVIFMHDQGVTQVWVVLGWSTLFDIITFFTALSRNFALVMVAVFRVAWTVWYTYIRWQMFVASIKDETTLTSQGTTLLYLIFGLFVGGFVIAFGYIVIRALGSKFELTYNWQGHPQEEARRQQEAHQQQVELQPQEAQRQQEGNRQQEAHQQQEAHRQADVNNDGESDSLISKISNSAQKSDPTGDSANASRENKGSPRLAST